MRQTVGRQLAKVTKSLQEVTDEAESEAKEILAHVYQTTYSGLVMRLFAYAEHDEKIDRIVEERLAGRPLAYILGRRFFYGRPFAVDERVLIPRNDTESVVEQAVRCIEANGCETAADICCGSGCIGITLLLETPLKKVVFADLSRDALDLAKSNAERLAPDAAADFLQGDLLSPLEEPVDILVCNPPYIAEMDYGSLEPQVRDYEPSLALLGGSDGLILLRRLIDRAPEFLRSGGMLLTEIGYDQKEPVLELFSRAGFEDIAWGQDLSGLPRWVSGRRTR